MVKIRYVTWGRFRGPEVEMATTPFFWSPEQRNLGWIACNIARKPLKLGVCPCIAFAFAILHRFFRQPIRPAPDMCLLLTAALFLACKIEEQFRPLATIFRELSGAFQQLESRVPRDQILALFGDRNYGSCELTDCEFRHIGLIEIEFLNALQWNMCIDLPSRHMPRITSIPAELPAQAEARQWKTVQDLCLIMKDDNYLDFPPELSAAVLVSRCFEDLAMPPRVAEWLETLKAKYPTQFISLRQRVAEQAALCVQVGRQCECEMRE
jgi:hypothetical protein